MKVLVDLLPVSYSHLNGVFVYGMRVIEGWYQAGIKDVVILTTPWLAENVILPKCPDYSVLTIDIPNVGYTKKCLKVGQLRKKVIDASGCDVVFTPLPEPFYYQTLKIPQVSVIHDMARGQRRWYQMYLLFPWQRIHCKKLIYITQYTKEQAHKQSPLLKLVPSEVIYNGVPFDEKQYAPIVEGKYILCVNTLSKYKNADTLVKAFGLVKDQIEENLILVGSDIDGRWNELQQIATQYGCIERVKRLSELSNEDIVSLYQHASLFVTPSTYEGFGYTPIEAAMYCCPVISSKCTALPETTKNLLNYYEPVMSESALANKIFELINNPLSKESLLNISNEFRRAYDVIHQAELIYNLLVCQRL